MSEQETPDRPDDIEVVVVTRDRDLGDAQPYPGLSGRWVARGRHRVYYLNVRSVGQWLHLWRELRTNLVYCNSFWSRLFTVGRSSPP